MVACRVETKRHALREVGDVRVNLDVKRNTLKIFVYKKHSEHTTSRACNQPKKYLFDMLHL